MLFANQPSIRETILFPLAAARRRAADEEPGCRSSCFLGFRYLRARGQRTNLSLFVWIGVGGVFLGVAALIVVLAVMTGFQDGIRDRSSRQPAPADLPAGGSRARRRRQSPPA
jgi:hypothetical protein